MQVVDAIVAVISICEGLPLLADAQETAQVSGAEGVTEVVQPLTDSLAQQASQLLLEKDQVAAEMAAMRRGTDGKLAALHTEFAHLAQELKELLLVRKQYQK